MLLGPVLSRPVLSLAQIDRGRADLYEVAFTCKVAGGSLYSDDIVFAVTFEDKVGDMMKMVEDISWGVTFEDIAIPKCWGRVPPALSDWTEQEAIGPCS